MPEYGFYRRIFYFGLIVGLLSALILPFLDVPGFIGILARHKSTIAFLAVTLGVAAALSFWALGPAVWIAQKRLVAVGTRMVIALFTAVVFLSEMWLAAHKFSVPLGLDAVNALSLLFEIFVYAYGAAIVVCFLVPDKTAEKHGLKKK